jgi:hypothetical protein
MTEDAFDLEANLKFRFVRWPKRFRLADSKSSLAVLATKFCDPGPACKRLYMPGTLQGYSPVSHTWYNNPSWSDSFPKKVPR